MTSTMAANVDGQTCMHLINHFDVAKYRPPFQYAMGTKIGQGGLSRGVFQATSKTDRTVYAVKCIALGSACNDRILKQGIKEFKSILRLNQKAHENVLNYFYVDIVYFDSFPELRVLMECCQGGNLNQKNQQLSLQRKRYKQADIVEDFRGILKGLCYLHKNKILHRDLKGQNILFSTYGTVKIADFGSMVELAASTTATYEVQGGDGTITYMPPEAFRREFGSIGRAYDIWSLGCVLLEMLQGHPPRFCRLETSGNLAHLLRPVEIQAALMAGEKPWPPKIF
ncbi:serine/threonine-protein kinase DDB_G0283821-like isoform X2 [Paramacrobiotus metropolitanus]|uniref:serine/threonine-protein kinase DDB_G0283821-like isoform X2 n=1 Tax=Paramacrobiotus metropolitanus TaxID=2943436 RepID=UPI0024463276|nr:serine/threonine-protein kinase DDB_G0283821-like isoform X2 [Paramacrobiotus metropolitanus]